MEYLWLFAPVWAALGALVTGLALRRLDISRMSYNEARLLLWAMIGTVQERTRKNEILTRQLCEQMEILKGSEASVSREELGAEKIRMLEYVQERVLNVRCMLDRVKRLEETIRGLDGQLREVQARADRIWAPKVSVSTQAKEAIVVTEDVIARLSETERKVLHVLYKGSKGAPEIAKLTGKSREHTARVMKILFEQGYVERETHRQPYQYRLDERVKAVLVEETIEAATQSAL